MLATLTDVEHFGDATDWAFEMKWDGVRTIAYLADGRVELRSRKGRDDTAAYFDVAEDSLGSTSRPPSWTVRSSFWIGPGGPGSACCRTAST